MDKIYLVLPKTIGTINPDIYGVFAEHIGGVIYDGIWAPDTKDNINGFRRPIIEKMKQARIPLVRWPGGCFAEIYDWRDGIGPREERPTRINFWHYRDGRYESNQVGTDEFMDFCRLCDAQPYFAANITSVTPLDIRDWIDYCNSPAGTTVMAKLREQNGHREPYNVKLWGVGNETWGDGGDMTPESYAMEYRRYVTVMNNASRGLELIASGANCFDYGWTRRMLETLDKSRRLMSGMSFHYYCGGAGDPLTFSDAQWYELLAKAGRMQELVERHWAAVVSYGMEKQGKLVIDEWGCWHPEGSGPSRGSNLFEQQSTMRDAAVSAHTLNIFNNNCEKIRLATVAQLVNNLHALFLSGGENCITTPTYHVFDMYKNHQGGQAVEIIAECTSCAEGVPGVSVSASVKGGKLTVTAANLSAEKDVTVKLVPFGGALGGQAEITILGDGDVRAHNTFDVPDRVKPVTKAVSSFDGTVEIPRGGIAAVCVKVEK
ncbi:MAG: alpha-L-arabinofuranosidase [Clostridia bacterium]|nr:alpha-L-arabinofuranosidase [Clostridia bacterium]